MVTSDLPDPGEPVRDARSEGGAWHNALDGEVHGPVVQAGSVNGGVQIHYHSADFVLVVPRQLPGVTRHFVGRSPEFDELDRALEFAEVGMPVILILSGMAGVGKTTLAIRWARHVIERFPHGQLYVDLRGFDPSGDPMGPQEALHTFITAFGIKPENVPTGLTARTHLFRSLLEDKRILIILDNVATVDQIYPLLSGSPYCLFIVTSRNHLTTLIASRGARPIDVQLLGRREALDLFARYLSEARIESEQIEVEELVSFCAGLPLALSIVAARAALFKWPLDSLVTDLRMEQQRLHGMDLHESEMTSVNAVFQWSYRQLPPDLARFFRLLGLNPGPDLSVAAAAALCGVTSAQANHMLSLLDDSNLITEHSRGRFQMHDLIRDFAAGLATEETQEDRRQAVERLLDFLLVTATAADQVIAPHRTRLAETFPSRTVSGMQFAGYDDAVRWLEAERTVLLEAQRNAVENGFSVHAWRLAWTLGIYLDRRGHASDRVLVTVRHSVRPTHSATRKPKPWSGSVSEPVIRVSVNLMPPSANFSRQPKHSTVWARRSTRPMSSSLWP